MVPIGTCKISAIVSYLTLRYLSIPAPPGNRQRAGSVPPEEIAPARFTPAYIQACRKRTYPSDRRNYAIAASVQAE